MVARVSVLCNFNLVHFLTKFGFNVLCESVSIYKNVVILECVSLLDKCYSPGM
jgi:hypothetical protein